MVIMHQDDISLTLKLMFTQDQESETSDQSSQMHPLLVEIKHIG